MDESGENFLVGKIACPYFDVLTKVGFPLASCDELRQWKPALGLF